MEVHRNVAEFPVFVWLAACCLAVLVVTFGAPRMALASTPLGGPYSTASDAAAAVCGYDWDDLPSDVRQKCMADQLRGFSRFRNTLTNSALDVTVWTSSADGMLYATLVDNARADLRDAIAQSNGVGGDGGNFTNYNQNQNNPSGNTDEPSTDEPITSGTGARLLCTLNENYPTSYASIMDAYYAQNDATWGKKQGSGTFWFSPEGNTTYPMAKTIEVYVRTNNAIFENQLAMGRDLIVYLSGRNLITVAVGHSSYTFDGTQVTIPSGVDYGYMSVGNMQRFGTDATHIRMNYSPDSMTMSSNGTTFSLNQTYYAIVYASGGQSVQDTGAGENNVYNYSPTTYNNNSNTTNVTNNTTTTTNNTTNTTVNDTTNNTTYNYTTVVTGTQDIDMTPITARLDALNAMVGNLGIDVQSIGSDLRSLDAEVASFHTDFARFGDWLYNLWQGLNLTLDKIIARLDLLDEDINALDFGGGSSSGGTVDVDMTETNDLLQDIADKLDALNSLMAINTAANVLDAVLDLLDDLLDAIGGVLDTLADAFGELTDVFPFSIPWDLAIIGGLLVHEPVTPVLDIALPRMGAQAVSIHVDLSAWDGAAEIARGCELILFGVGLALNTREMMGIGDDVA